MWFPALGHGKFELISGGRGMTSRLLSLSFLIGLTLVLSAGARVRRAPRRIDHWQLHVQKRPAARQSRQGCGGSGGDVQEGRIRGRRKQTRSRQHGDAARDPRIHRHCKKCRHRSRLLCRPRRHGSAHWYAARASGSRKTAALPKLASAASCATRRAESASARREQRQVRPRATKAAAVAAAARSFVPNAVVAARSPRIAGSSTAVGPAERAQQAWPASASFATSRSG